MVVARRERAVLIRDCPPLLSPLSISVFSSGAAKCWQAQIGVVEGTAAAHTDAALRDAISRVPIMA